MRGAWIGVDGDEAARRVSERLAAAVGARVLHIPPGEKPRYHAAAVFASNFPTVLMCLAEELLRHAGIESDVARRALHPLFASAVENLREGEGTRALTGPIVRGDADTVKRHLLALRADPDTLDAYRALSRAALRWLREAGEGDEEPAGRDRAAARRYWSITVVPDGGVKRNADAGMVGFSFRLLIVTRLTISLGSVNSN